MAATIFKISTWWHTGWSFDQNPQQGESDKRQGLTRIFEFHCDRNLGFPTTTWKHLILILFGRNKEIILVSIKEWYLKCKCLKCHDMSNIKHPICNWNRLEQRPKSVSCKTGKTAGTIKNYLLKREAIYVLDLKDLKVKKIIRNLNKQ